MTKKVISSMKVYISDLENLLLLGSDGSETRYNDFSIALASLRAVTQFAYSMDLISSEEYHEMHIKLREFINRFYDNLAE